MKTYFLSSFVFLFMMMNSRVVSAQQITFNQVFPPERPFRFINGVTQDTLGYMWFSSYGIGLIRYDGYQVTLLRNDPGDSNSLATNNVVCVCADHNGIIWVGTQAGLDRMDPVTGIFTHFRHKAENPNSLSNDTVEAILEDHDGTVWVGTENGLNRMNIKTGTFTRYQQDPANATTLSCNRVQVLYEDRQGTLWVGTANHQRFFDSSEQGGLNRFNRKTGKFIRYLHDPKDSLTLINDRIGAIFEDTRGVFWVSTAGDGLHTMDREKGTFQRYTYDASHPDKLSGPPPQNDVGLDLNNFFVTEDSSGAIWIASSKRWVTRYDPKTKKVHHFDSFNGDVHAARSVTEAFSSHEGVLWLTTWRGHIFRVDPFEVTIPYVYTGSSVHAVREDASGTLWLGTSGEGLIQTESKKGSVKQFFTDLPGSYGLSDSFITAICEEDDSTLWIGSSNGLNRYDRKTKTFTRYIDDPHNKTSLRHGFVTAIAEDKPRSLWIAFREGLDRFDINSGVFTHYQNDPNDSTSLGGTGVSSLLRDHSGNLWAGHRNGTLSLFNSQTGKFKRFSYGAEKKQNAYIVVNSITEDAENIIWVGTSQGLYRSNPAVDTFLLFTEPEIGLTATTIIACILEDDKKNLWVSSSAGILRLNPKRDEITVYSGNQGVDASDLTHAWGHNMQGAKGRRGELFFGDTTGYYAFFPDQLKRNVTPPQVVITDFRLADNQPVKPGKGSPLNVPISYTKEICLKYNQNAFSFDFIGIHYSSPEEIRILFMMESLDNTWRKASREKKAFYYNVPPGRYIFHVKAANRDGVWSEKNILIIIAPPWWRTWWAYTLFSIAFLIALWSLIKWREKTLRNEKIVLEKKVAIRTLELQKEKEKVEATLAELKIAQEQLIEAEKRAAIEKSRQAVLNERLRISRELHDEVGATLSSISIFSQAAIQKNESGNIADSKSILEKIGETSREVMSELNDVVWLINPLNDNLQKIIQRISNYTVPLCRTRDIQFEIKNDLIENPALGIEKRKAVYLIMKEAINNSVKYAAAKKLAIQFEKKCESLHISVKDDGKGFDKNDSFAGNGLNNMRQRAKDIKGKIDINSASQHGTKIILQVPLTNIGD